MSRKRTLRAAAKSAFSGAKNSIKSRVTTHDPVLLWHDVARRGRPPLDADEALPDGELELRDEDVEVEEEVQVKPVAIGKVLLGTENRGWRSVTGRLESYI